MSNSLLWKNRGRFHAVDNMWQSLLRIFEVKWSCLARAPLRHVRQYNNPIIPLLLPLLSSSFFYSLFLSFSLVGVGGGAWNEWCGVLSLLWCGVVKALRQRAISNLSRILKNTT